MDLVGQLFSGNPGGWVHGKFIRYGRGAFDGPEIAVKVGKAVKVSGSEEYCNAIGFVIVASCPGSFEVSGSVVGKDDFRGLLRDAGIAFKDKSKKGLYSVEVSGEFSSDALNGVYSSAGGVSVLLSLKSAGGRDYSLKCKKKLPKPGGKKDSDFFSASLGLDAMKLLVGTVFFDAGGNFTEAIASHKYVITEIVPPAGVADPARIRVDAKRKGVIERKLVVDGKEKVSRKDFLV